MKALSLILLSALLASCSKKEDAGAKLRRDPTKDPVVVVDERSDGRETVVEANSADESASQPVPLGAVITGRLEGSLDVDRYSLVVAGPGWLNVEVGGAKDADLKLDLVNQSGKIVARSDRGPAGTSEGVRGFPVSAGTYQVHVAEFTKKKDRKDGGRKGISEPYELVSDFSGANEDGYEAEPNESDGKVLIPGQVFSGFLGWRGDVDVWKIAFDPDASDKKSWMLEVSGIPQAVLQLKWQESAGEPLAVRSSSSGEGIFLGPFQTYTSEYQLSLSGSRNDHESSYIVRVAEYELKPGEELEPNDQYKRASEMAPEVEGRVFRALGTLMRGDIDFLKVPNVAVPSIVRIRLNNLESGAQAMVVDAAGGVHANLPSGSSEMEVQASQGVELALRLESPTATERRAYSVEINVSEGTLAGPMRVPMTRTGSIPVLPSDLEIVDRQDGLSPE